jgi:hypothetical protein
MTWVVVGEVLRHMFEIVPHGLLRVETGIQGSA